MPLERLFPGGEAGPGKILIEMETLGELGWAVKTLPCRYDASLRRGELQIRRTPTGARRGKGRGRGELAAPVAGWGEEHGGGSQRCGRPQSISLEILKRLTGVFEQVRY